MSDLREAAERAIEALIRNDSQRRAESIIELREALNQPDYRDKDIADLTKACQVLLRENLRLQEELNK